MNDGKLELGLGPAAVRDRRQRLLIDALSPPSTADDLHLHFHYASSYIIFHSIRLQPAIILPSFNFSLQSFFSSIIVKKFFFRDKPSEKGRIRETHMAESNDFSLSSAHNSQLLTVNTVFARISRLQPHHSLLRGCHGVWDDLKHSFMKSLTLSGAS